MPAKTDYWGFTEEVQQDSRTNPSEAFMRSDVFGGILFTQWLPRTFSVTNANELRSVTLNAREGDTLYYIGQGVLWQFVYNPVPSDFLWKFIGGAPLIPEVGTDETTTTVNAANGVDLATVGPTTTIPFSGVYEYSYGAELYDSATASNYLFTWLASYRAGSLSQQVLMTHLQTATTQSEPISRSGLFSLAANDVMKVQYSLNAAGTGHWRNRWLRILPVRVG